VCQGSKEYSSLDEKTKDMIDAIIRISKNDTECDGFALLLQGFSFGQN